MRLRSRYFHRLSSKYFEKCQTKPKLGQIRGNKAQTDAKALKQRQNYWLTFNSILQHNDFQIRKRIEQLVNESNHLFYRCIRYGELLQCFESAHDLKKSLCPEIASLRRDIVYRIIPLQSNHNHISSPLHCKMLDRIGNLWDCFECDSLYV